MERRDFLPYLLLLPAILYLLGFIGYPLIQAFYLAFTKDGALSLETFRRAISDYYFWDALKNTLLFGAVIVPIQLALAVLLALFMNRTFKGRDLGIYALIIPLTISDVAAGLIWFSMLSPYGFVNKILINLGITDAPIYFFGYQFRAREFFVIVLAEIWRATSIVFVIILAGLQMISKEYIEAAEVFGAGYWTRLRHIVLPMLKPSIQSALIIRTLFAMQIFGIVLILAGRDIPVLAAEGFRQMVDLKDPGVASIYALIIAAISLVLAGLYVKFLKAEYLEVGER
ncbi:carbohydrate ABC transporter permease [Thermococcus thioreducens]|uniref:ABC transporter permease n=1 Tax=Thermococcus thioreducens TaxID=277988 RepID=A0A1I0M2D2_9EURY|nr:sugar ABC transporter permease [Thermococcus thioreducens]ASJ13559.1 ABC transporter permease [Thermococcus thioreducens]SEV82104.1 carbohydrate ABC transporter membrane protein 1, CUT1 family [Thermococcus thioreducens]